MVSLFNAGPAKMPCEVLEQIKEELFDYKGTGISVLETSHRSAEFTQCLNETKQLLRDILEIPDNYQILFLQGGGSGQFAAVPLNLITSKDDKVDYIVTGSWSNAAAKEAEKFTNVNYVLPKVADYTGVPAPEQFKFDSEAKYVYYCDNETVVGTEFKKMVKGNGVDVVVDMSSNFLSRPFEVSNYAVIFAGAQKNVAPAGLTIVIVRDDVIGRQSVHPVPKVWDYKLQVAGNSCVNTPAVFSIYCCNLVMKWIVKQGGLKYFEELSDKKSSMIYDIIDNSNGYYNCKIEKDSRSRMNLTFNLESAELEAKFVKEATAVKLQGLKGHRSVGGIRASLYNAVTVKDVNRLAEFMTSFMATN